MFFFNFQKKNFKHFFFNFQKKNSKNFQTIKFWLSYALSSWTWRNGQLYPRIQAARSKRSQIWVPDSETQCYWWSTIFQQKISHIFCQKLWTKFSEKSSWKFRKKNHSPISSRLKSSKTKFYFQKKKLLTYCPSPQMAMAGLQLDFESNIPG